GRSLPREVAGPHLQPDLLLESAHVLAGDLHFSLGLLDVEAVAPSGEQRKAQGNACGVWSDGRAEISEERLAAGREHAHRGQPLGADGAYARTGALGHGARGAE